MYIYVGITRAYECVCMAHKRSSYLQDKRRMPATTRAGQEADPGWGHQQASPPPAPGEKTTQAT